MSGYFEIAEYRGNVYSRYIGEYDNTVYMDTVLDTAYIEDYASFEDAKREADRLVDLLQEKVYEEEWRMECAEIVEETLDREEELYNMAASFI